METSTYTITGSTWKLQHTQLQDQLNMETSTYTITGSNQHGNFNIHNYRIKSTWKLQHTQLQDQINMETLTYTITGSSNMETSTYTITGSNKHGNFNIHNYRIKSTWKHKQSMLLMFRYI